MFVKAVDYPEQMLIGPVYTHQAKLMVERAIMGTNRADHAIDTLVYVVSPVLKFPAGTKGKNLSLRLVKQKGYVDSIGVVYKPRSIK